MGYGKVIDYVLLTDRTIGGLEGKIRSRIRANYEPVGGISLVSNPLKGSGVEEYCQGMVKREFSDLTKFLLSIFTFRDSYRSKPGKTVLKKESFKSEHLEPFSERVAGEISPASERVAGEFNSDITDWDPLLHDIAKEAYTRQSISASEIQRFLKIGYNRAVNILNQLQTLEIIEPFSGNSSRKIIVSDENHLNNILFNIKN